MISKSTVDAPAHARRKALALDVEEFLKSGHKIQQIPTGVSSQDPRGRIKPLRKSNGKPD